MDGFIKTNEECLSILPPVYKLIPGSQSSHALEPEQENNSALVNKQNGTHPKLKQPRLQSTSIIGNLEHLDLIGPSKQPHPQVQDNVELLQKPNVLPLNYEFQ